MVKKERWALPLQVDNMYTRGGVGELRGGGREGVKIEQIEGERERRWGGEREREDGEVGQREFYRYSGEGEAWLKESTPMETNKILFKLFICLYGFFVCFLFTSEAPLAFTS